MSATKNDLPLHTKRGPWIPNSFRPGIPPLSETKNDLPRRTHRRPWIPNNFRHGISPPSPLPPSRNTLQGPIPAVQEPQPSEKSSSDSEADTSHKAGVPVPGNTGSILGTPVGALERPTPPPTSDYSGHNTASIPSKPENLIISPPHTTVAKSSGRLPPQALREAETSCCCTF
jgi:hypothetical protein